MMTSTATVWTVNSIKDALRARSSHWFDPDTMRSFATRVLDTVYQGPGGIFFVTSEKSYDGKKRCYNVRQFTLPGHVDTVGDFNEWSKARAIARAKHLAAEPLAAQWLAAFRALDEAVTGADLGKTFNAERNYVGIDKALSEILYFAGDGGYTRAKVREYSDSSGLYMDLIETGATDRQTAWNAAYKLQREACRVLMTYASDSFSGEVHEMAERFAPVTVLEQFVKDLAAHCVGGRTAPASEMGKGLVKALISCAWYHHHYMELLCGDEAFCRGVNADGEHPRALDCRGRIETLAAELGAKGVIFSGDPRGCTVKLVFEDGTTNDFGKEGYCVPTEESEVSE